MSAMSAGLSLPKIPDRLIVKPDLSDDEFEQLCLTNSDLALERTKEGEIIVSAPASSGTGDGNAEIITQLRTWWKTHRRGRVYDSSTGVFLPDRSCKSPDAAYITAEQASQLTKDDLDHFLRFVPAFVIELRSKTDTFAELDRKMVQWVDNGAQLGWLVDPYTRTVQIYGAPCQEKCDQVRGTGPVAGFILDLDEVWSCYHLD